MTAYLIRFYIIAQGKEVDEWLDQGRSMNNNVTYPNLNTTAIQLLYTSYSSFRRRRSNSLYY